MKNKETLEEAAEIFVSNRFFKQINGDKTYPDIYASKESIVESHILFTRWQQKRMYREEDLLGAFEAGMMFIGEDIGSFNEWFENFKKK